MLSNIFNEKSQVIHLIPYKIEIIQYMFYYIKNTDVTISQNGKMPST